MKRVPSPSSSLSYVLGKVPESYPEYEITKLFHDKVKIERIVYHFAGSTFLHKATIVFSDENSAKAASCYVGKKIPGTEMNLSVPYIPNNFSSQKDKERLTMKKPYDEIGIPVQSKRFDWKDLSEIPSLEEETKILFIRFNF